MSPFQSGKEMANSDVEVVEKLEDMQEVSWSKEEENRLVIWPHGCFVRISGSLAD